MGGAYAAYSRFVQAACRIGVIQFCKGHVLMMQM